jgi:HAD superfamily hydrolase (TIGR01549 family)
MVIKWIFLDLDDTILPNFAHYIWNEAFPRKIAEERKISIEDAKKLIFNSSVKGAKWKDKLSSKRSLEWYDFYYWLKKFKSKVRFDEIFEEGNHLLKISKEDLKFLKKIKKLFKVGLISNNFSYFVEKCLDRLNIKGYFDLIITPDKTGAVKPDKKVFIAALKSANVKPQEILYVGDNPIDDLGAKEVGLRVALLMDRRYRVKPASEPDFKINKLEELLDLKIK